MVALEIRRLGRTAAACRADEQEASFDELRRGRTRVCRQRIRVSEGVTNEKSLVDVA